MDDLVVLFTSADLLKLSQMDLTSKHHSTNSLLENVANSTVTYLVNLSGKTSSGKRDDIFLNFAVLSVENYMAKDFSK